MPEIAELNKVERSVNKRLYRMISELDKGDEVRLEVDWKHGGPLNESIVVRIHDVERIRHGSLSIKARMIHRENANRMKQRVLIRAYRPDPDPAGTIGGVTIRRGWSPPEIVNGIVIGLGGKYWWARSSDVYHDSHCPAVTAPDTTMKETVRLDEIPDIWDRRRCKLCERGDENR